MGGRRTAQNPRCCPWCGTGPLEAPVRAIRDLGEYRVGIRGPASPVWECDTHVVCPVCNREWRLFWQEPVVAEPERKCGLQEG